MNKVEFGVDAGLLLMLFAALIFLGAIAQAEVSVQCSFYNSEDEVSMSLEGENLGFGAEVILEPDFLSYENGGGSNGENSHYSYNLNFNGESISTGAETNTGGFGWSAIANSNIDGEDSKAFFVKPHSQVADGYLDTYSANSDLSVGRSIAVKNGYYSETSTISADNLNSKGSGIIANKKTETSSTGDNNKGSTASTDTNKGSTDLTDTNVDVKNSGSTSQNNGFIQLMTMSGDKKESSVNMVVQGDTQAKWGDYVETKPALHVFEVGVDGHTDSSVDALNLGMTGKATGYPTQSLPPGRIKITETETNPADAKATETQKFIDSLVGDFNTDYGLSPKLLWYYLNQNAWINPIPQDPKNGGSSSTGDYYHMGMGFAFKEA
jgi:hypothetical protein